MAAPVELLVNEPEHPQGGLRAQEGHLRPPAAGAGVLHSQQVGLWLGVRPTRFSNIAEPTLRWIDEDGRVLPTPDERAEEERARADDLAARLREYEARFGPLGR